MAQVDAFVNHYKVHILSGKLLEGHCLPAADQLALEWSCDIETIESGFKHLADMHLIKIEPEQSALVLDYKERSKMETLEFIFGSPEVKLENRRVQELYDFIKVTFDDFIRLVAKKGLSEVEKEDLLKHLWRDGQYSDEMVFREKVFDFYKTVAMHSDNFVYPLLMNTMKSGICNIVSCIEAAPKQMEIISMFIMVIDALAAKDEDHALFMNRQVMARILMEWKRHHA